MAIHACLEDGSFLQRMPDFAVRSEVLPSHLQNLHFQSIRPTAGNTQRYECRTLWWCIMTPCVQLQGRAALNGEDMSAFERCVHWQWKTKATQIKENVCCFKCSFSLWFASSRTMLCAEKCLYNPPGWHNEPATTCFPSWHWQGAPWPRP